MVDQTKTEVPVNFWVDEELWTNAKISAIKEKLSLKDFVARAILHEITNSESERLKIQ